MRPSSSNPLSIAVIDDHPILVGGLCQFLSGMPEYRVIATGQCADDLVNIARTHSPDVILTDLRMPGDSLAAIKFVTTANPNLKVIAFTAIAEVNSATRALEAGALGYILKGASTDELVGAIRSVVAGQNYITPAFAAKVIASLRQAPRPNEQNQVKFNVREAQIIKLLLGGATNKEIGQQLNISEKTVRHYMTLLMRKLNVRNRLEVVLKARGADAALH